MTDKQRRGRIMHLVMAGADISRRPRRPIDAELHALVNAGTRRREQTNPRRTGRNSQPSSAAQRTDRIQFAALIW